MCDLLTFLRWTRSHLRELGREHPLVNGSLRLSKRCGLQRMCGDVVRDRQWQCYKLSGQVDERSTFLNAGLKASLTPGVSPVYYSRFGAG